ncbi:MAG: DMT family transporter [Pontibacterium sp.]
MSPQNLSLGVFFGVSTSLTMSLAAALIKYCSAQVSIETIVLIQYLVCLLIMLPWLARKGLGALQTKHPGLHLIRGLSGWACFYCYYLALNAVPLVDAALLRNSAPLCVPLILLFWKGIRIKIISWLPILTGLAGIMLVLKPGGEGLSFWHLIGFGSAIALAGSMVCTRVLTKTEPGNRIIFYYFLISTVIALPPALIDWQPVPMEAWLPLILIGLSIWLVMWLYTQAYRYAKASVISPLNYLGVVFTGFWGWVFWEQSPDTFALIGACLVISGGILAVFLGKVIEK